MSWCQTQARCEDQTKRCLQRNQKMRSMMWIYIMVVFLSKSWSLESGTNETTPVKPNTTSPPIKVYVKRKEVFNLGSSVNLTCSSRMWKETLFVIWNLNLKHKTCRVSFSNDGQNVDSCNDGKLLQNTTTGQSYLHIPNISADDVGLYRCESVYSGGNDNYEINVTITVPPALSAWLERRANKKFAVCRAEGGNPAANISWSLTGNSESVKTLPGSDGFVTVESELELPEGMNPENLSCIVRHQFWDQERSLVPEPREGFWHQTSSFSSSLWLRVVVTILVVAGFSFCALNKLISRYRQSDTASSPPSSVV